MNAPSRLFLSAAVGLLALFLAARLPGAEPAEDLTALRAQADGVSPDAMLHAYLMDMVREATDRREAEFEKLETPEQIAAYQKRLREFFVKQLGGILFAADQSFGNLQLKSDATRLNLFQAGLHLLDSFLELTLSHQQLPEFQIGDFTFGLDLSCIAVKLLRLCVALSSFDIGGANHAVR